MMQAKKIVLAAAIALLAVACAGQKEPATKAVADAEAALSAVKAQAAQYVPEQLQSVESTLTGLKDSLAKGDFKGVLAAAPQLTSQLAALKDAAAAKKVEMDAAIEKAKSDWSGYAADLPNMVGAIQSRVDILSKARKLPAGMDKAKLDGAMQGLEAMKSTWTDAGAAFASGNVLDAVAKAQQVKASGTQIMADLGMSSGS
jgi:hypothetical protein